MKTSRKLIWVFSLLAVIASVALAQNLQTEAEQDPVENRYRVGLDCAPVSEALQVHLRLDQGSGLLVNGIMEGSPAESAGVKRLDIIVEANQRPVGTVAEFVSAINDAGDTDMTIMVVRRGEEMSLSVRPVERDEEEMEQLRRGFQNRMQRPGWQGFGALPPEVQKQLEQFGPLDEFFRGDDLFGGRGFRRLLPGIVMDEEKTKKLPNGFNLNMRVERAGDGPAKVIVEQDDKTWEVTEDNLDDLPKELRPMVENMLNGNSNRWSGLNIPAGQGPVLRAPAKTSDKDNPVLKKRFDGLELQLQELQNAIRSLREQE